MHPKTPDNNVFQLAIVACQRKSWRPRNDCTENTCTRIVWWFKIGLAPRQNREQMHQGLTKLLFTLCRINEMGENSLFLVFIDYFREFGMRVTQVLPPSCRNFQIVIWLWKTKLFTKTPRIWHFNVIALHKTTEGRIKMPVARVQLLY